MMSAGDSHEMHSSDQDEAGNVQRETDEQSTHTSSPAISFSDADEIGSDEFREDKLIIWHPWRCNRNAERKAGVPNALQLEPSDNCVISTQLRKFALSCGVRRPLVDFFLGPSSDQEQPRCRQERWDSEITPLSLENRRELWELCFAASAKQRSVALLLAAWGSWDEKLLGLLLNKCSPADADFSFTDDAGRSALHLAALRGNDVCLKMLIDAGAPVNVLDTNDWAVTPLCCAAYGRHKDCVKLLLDAGATDEVVDADDSGTESGAAKMSALYCAALSCGRPPRFIEGSTLLESCLAAGNDSFKCVEYLLTKKNVNVNFRYQVTGMTPMHLAAMYDSPRVLSELKKAGGDVDCWVGKTLDNPYYLEKGNIKGTWNITPLHLAAAYRNLECIQALLKAGANANGEATTHDRGYGSCWVTPLHLAVASSGLHIIDILRDAGWPAVDLVGINSRYWVRWCMMIGCWRGASELVRRYNCTRTLLDIGNKADPNPPTNGADIRAVSPLLMAVRNGFDDLVEGKCVRLLLQRGAGDACARYPRGGNLAEESALEFMARFYPREVLGGIFKDTFDGCVKLRKFNDSRWILADQELLEFDFEAIIINNGNSNSSGGNVDHDPESGHSCVSGQAPGTPPEGSTHHAISTGGAAAGESRARPTQQVPSTLGEHEMRLFTGLIQAGQSQLLTHPLCEAYIHFKWEKTKRFFVLNLLVYIVFAVALTWYEWSVFREPCMRQKQCSDDDLPLNNLTTANNITGNCTQECQVKKLHTALHRKRYLHAPNITAAWHTLILLVVLLAAKELISLSSHGHGGIKQYMMSCWENLLQMVILISSAILLAAGADGDDDHGHYIPAWMYHIAAITVFAAWLKSFFIVGRFPSHGVYIQMFIMVLKNFAEFFTAFVALILAFATSFAILFSSVATFSNPFEGILSTIVMMTGELGYSDAPFFRTADFSKGQDELALDMPGTSHVIYLLFLIIVVIVMVNLLTGMAVNDIRSLQKNAKQVGLVRRCELIAQVESLALSKLCTLLLPKRMFDAFHRAVFLRIYQSAMGPSWRCSDEHRRKVLRIKIQGRTRVDEECLPRELFEAAVTLAHTNGNYTEEQRGYYQWGPATDANDQRSVEQIMHLLSILKLEQDYMERPQTTDFMRKLRRDLQRMVNEAMDRNVGEKHGPGLAYFVSGENQQGAPVVPIHPVNRPALDVAPDDSDHQDEETREDESLV